MLHFLIIILINYLFIYDSFKTQEQRLPITENREIKGQGEWHRLIILINLLNLFFFKYFYFILRILLDITGLNIFAKEEFDTFLNESTGFGRIILPLAISFYTFQLIAFQMDVKRRIVQEKPTFLEFAVFILFFPQLVAGPIVRHGEFFHQLKEIKPNEKQMITGSYLILLGLIKKILIADNISGFVTGVYQNPENFNWQMNLLALCGFSIQIYNDFSGYTDIARGLGFLMGLELPENFKGPFLSRSISEMWQRWHITLSTWLRDYIYIPLGGSKTSVIRARLNLIITFIIGGIWHGANYTYLIWGMIHATVIVFERIFSIPGRLSKNGVLNKLQSIMLISYAYLIFMISAIPFNSPNIETAWKMTKQILLAGTGINFGGELVPGFLVVTLLLNYLQYNELQNKLFLQFKWPGLLFFGLICLILLGKYTPGGNAFIYFQF